MSDIMKATDLEKALLVEFFRIKGIERKEILDSLSEVEVLRRSVAGSGFMTEFKRHPCLRVGDSNQSYISDDIGGWINEERIQVAFTFYIEKGYIEAVEGGTFGEAWPERVTCYELIT